jgi:1-acyl-sn-glycerol-3-phosphate acyltransferase
MFRSIIIVAAALCITALTAACVVVINIFSAAEKLNRRIGCRWARILLAISGVKIEIIGTGNIVSRKPSILMANHQSDFDILICMAGIPVDFIWTAKKELFGIPVFGQAMRASGFIEIDRQDRGEAIKSLSQAAAKLQEGVSVATFPEGTRSRDGQLLPFKQGLFYLAIQTGMPIVPVSIIGSGNIMSKKSWRVNRGKIIMVIDPPIEVSGYTIETRAALMEAVRNSISANLEKYSL